MDKKNTTESVGIAQARPSTVRFTLASPAGMATVAKRQVFPERGRSCDQS